MSARRRPAVKNGGPFNFAGLEEAGGLDIQALQLLAEEITEGADEQLATVSWPNWASRVFRPHAVPCAQLDPRDRADLLLLDEEFLIIDRRLRRARRPRWDLAADREHIARLQALIEAGAVQPHWGLWTRSPPDAHRRR
jgi:hypothetical protein